MLKIKIKNWLGLKHTGYLLTYYATEIRCIGKKMFWDNNRFHSGIAAAAAAAATAAATAAAAAQNK